ncbi:MAG: hypothetical protein D4R77_00055 [Planctomycetaceae bacterium]|nr:MAG: hypothetical protein D4R77_00055 [Planctomycetaceae bacterium]
MIDRETMQKPETLFKKIWGIHMLTCRNVTSMRHIDESAPPFSCSRIIFRLNQKVKGSDFENLEFLIL